MSSVFVAKHRVGGPSSGRSHDAFPGAAVLPGGRLLVCWRGSSSHVGGTSGAIFTSSSSDGGRTWGKSSIAVEGSPDVRDPSLAVTPDGSTIWLSYFSYATPSDPRLAPWVVKSDDGGESWGDPVRVSGAQAAIAAPLVRVESGALLAPLYGPQGGRDTVTVAHSPDAGATWFPGATVGHGYCDGRDYQEPWVSASGGRLVMAMRYGNADRIAFSYSTDSGGSWSVPEPAFPGSGRPSLVSFSTGALVCLYRDVSTRAAMVRTSRDGGGSWGPPRVFDADTVQFSYAAPVEVFPGVAAVPYALERGSVSGSLSALYLRYLIDSPAASPIGDSFVDPSARVAARPRQVLAFDDFDRPDQDVLERSPSGAAWVSSGALAVKGGELRTTGAGVSVAYVTLADGDHEVEADVKWVGNTGPSVLFRGVDASTYLMASVEGAGSYVRLYKVEGGAATQLGAATEASRSGQWVTLRVAAFGDHVRVYVDGHRVMTHTLSSADAATFSPSAARRSGLRFSATSSSSWSSSRRFVVSV